MKAKRFVILSIATSLLAASFFFLGQTGAVFAASDNGRGPGGPGNPAMPQGAGQDVTNPGGPQGAGQGVANRNAVQAPGTPGGRGYGYGMSGQAGAALTPLSAQEAEGLQDAILEEYGALNLYQSVIAQFGNVYPFSQIAASEQQHTDALVRQAEKYGVSVPANPGLAQAPTFATLADACKAGVAAEIADAELYDTLKAFTTHADLLRVYDNLQAASLNNHLPAFQTCD